MLDANIVRAVKYYHRKGMTPRAIVDICRYDITEDDVKEALNADYDPQREKLQTEGRRMLRHRPKGRDEREWEHLIRSVYGDVIGYCNPICPLCEFKRTGRAYASTS